MCAKHPAGDEIRKEKKYLAQHNFPITSALQTFSVVNNKQESLNLIRFDRIKNDAPVRDGVQGVS